MLEGPRADSEEKHEPASDADAAVVESLKALDPNRPIREADSCSAANLRLFDHLVGSGEHGRRELEAERFGGLQIDDQLELGRSDDR